MGNVWLQPLLVELIIYNNLLERKRLFEHSNFLTSSTYENCYIYRFVIYEVCTSVI